MEIPIRKALNLAYRKHKPSRKQVNDFLEALETCLQAIELFDQQGETEEHLKEPLKKFFQGTFFQENLINTKERIDLAIYAENNPQSPVEVLIEIKKPSNKIEFLTPQNLNKKALQELLLYYFRERFDQKNNAIKHLIVTNGYEWYLFKAEDFYTFFYKNKNLLNDYQDFRDGKKDSRKNELFYNEIAKKYIQEIQDQLPFVYIDFRTMDLKNLDDISLNNLYKLFSNVHLLGHSFANDSNELNQEFYEELLHIIGLEEVSQDGKNIICRKSKNRHNATLLESTLFLVEDRIDLENIEFTEEMPFEENKSEKESTSFQVALELTLTWVNRILFIKLLESQLINYHKTSKEHDNYQFLTNNFIPDFDGLNTLFFSALAKKPEERHSRYKNKFALIPYLNSSLFEKSELEKSCFDVSALPQERLHISETTVLKDREGKRLKGELYTLDYLFQFLDAYDFATDGTEGISEGETPKTLINAAVLGLFFEKINGYQDGSFFTPAYITMYMCRNSLRPALVQRFKISENPKINTFEDLKNHCKRFFKKNDIDRLNVIFNGLKVCDPSVGSGHFLVSALNELIMIKYELGLLTDQEGNVLNCGLSLQNDELHISYRNGELFHYYPKGQSSGIIQKTFFRHKQELIENCLFGVDLNQKSVDICRLRLWIELLKHAYYKNDGQLETLPNIDINIKRGNSILSKFSLDNKRNTFTPAQKNKIARQIADYKILVDLYKSVEDKKAKDTIRKKIHEHRTFFQATYNPEDSDYILMKTKDAELEKALRPVMHNGEGALKIVQLNKEIEFYKQRYAAKQKVYQGAFEWRFEFPEVLDEKGNFIGFDVVVGNPPYIQLQNLPKELVKLYKEKNFKTYTPTGDIYTLFFEKGLDLVKTNGYLGLITSNKWMRASYGKKTRQFFITQKPLALVDMGSDVFGRATVDTAILFLHKKQVELCRQKKNGNGIKKNKKSLNLDGENKNGKIKELPALDLTKAKKSKRFDFSVYDKDWVVLKDLTDEPWLILTPLQKRLKEKIETRGIPLKEWDISIYRGVLTGFNEAFIINQAKRDELLAADPKSADIIKPILRGRDIRKYEAKWANLYIIKTFPALKIDIDNYPAVKNYLKSFGDKLEQLGKTYIDADGNRQKSRKKTGNKWFETQDQIAYYKNFEKEKIIYPETTQGANFWYDATDKFLVEKTSFIMTGNNLKYLLSIMSSSTLTFYYKKCSSGTVLGKKGYQYNKHAVENIPIPQLSRLEQKPFENLVDKILKAKVSGKDSIIYEEEIDRRVFELYGLTEEEIQLVENV